jgi:hypothetical protein|tara:strand:- start:5944 stop:6243 length:300 start_codon:yes stop_codon:yes gene_type:complete
MWRALFSRFCRLRRASSSSLEEELLALDDDIVTQNCISESSVLPRLFLKCRELSNVREEQHRKRKQTRREGRGNWAKYKQYKHQAKRKKHKKKRLGRGH